MASSLKWYQIDVSYACAGIGTDTLGVVHEAAPIFKWTIGKTLDYVAHWVQSRRGTLTQLDDYEPPGSGDRFKDTIINWLE